MANSVFKNSVSSLMSAQHQNAVRVAGLVQDERIVGYVVLDNVTGLQVAPYHTGFVYPTRVDAWAFVADFMSMGGDKPEQALRDYVAGRVEQGGAQPPARTLVPRLRLARLARAGC